MSHGPKLLCDCGCLQDGYRNKMTVVEAIEHHRSEEAHIQRPMHRFLVLKEHETFLKRELEVQESLRAMVGLLEQRFFLFRWPHAWALYSGLVDRFKRTRENARRLAILQTFLVMVPEWLSRRVAAWQMGRQPSA